MYLASEECLILEMAARNTSLIELFSDPFSFYAPRLLLRTSFSQWKLEKKKEGTKKKKKGLASGIQCINTNFNYSNEKIKIERIRELQPTNES